MGLIFDENYREIDAFYDFVLNEVGADKLKLNFLQPSFGHGGVVDEFFRDHHDVDPDELYDIIGACDEKYKLGLNPVWRDQVRMYFRSLRRAGDIERGWSSSAGTEQHICNTYERNVMVDHYGVARLCFSHNFPGMPLKKYGDLARFWEAAESIRRTMRAATSTAASATACGARRAPSASRRPLPIPVVQAPAEPRRVLMDFSYRIVAAVERPRAARLIVGAGDGRLRAPAAAIVAHASPRRCESRTHHVDAFFQARARRSR